MTLARLRSTAPAALLMVLAACVPARPPASATPSVDEENLVLAAVIRNLASDSKSGAWAVSTRTIAVSWENGLPPKKFRRQWGVHISDEALEDLVGPRAATAVDIPTQVGAGTGVRWLSPDDTEAFERIPHDPRNWRARVDKVFPGLRSLTYPSRPGFTRDGRRAVVRMESDCGPLCGGGSLLTLRRGRDGTWTVDGSMVLTIA